MNKVLLYVLLLLVLAGIYPSVSAGISSIAKPIRVRDGSVIGAQKRRKTLYLSPRDHEWAMTEFVEQPPLTKQ